MYYVTSVVWPARETMLERAVTGFEDYVEGDHESSHADEIDAKEKRSADVDVRAV